MRYIGFLGAILVAISCTGQTTTQTQKRYGYGLPATGSEKTIHTIYTNPGEDCSTMMNISFATPVGTDATVEVTGGGETLTFESTGKECRTFDNVKSKLTNGKDVIEKHVFDKHEVILKGLKPDTEYSYVILADSAGYTVESDEHTFCTAGAASWRAAVIGDFHHYAPLWRRLENAMGMIDVLDSVSGGVDWVLTTGDQSSWGGSYNFWTELSEQPAYIDFMWAAVQGNHDHATSDKIKSDAYFRDSHFFPNNGYEGQEGVSYWFKYGDVLFIMLNNEAMRKSGSLTPALEWMEKVVEENPTKYIVVVEHSEWLIGTDGKSSNLDRFRKTFDRLGVDLAISGNNHAYIRTYPLLDRQPVEPGEGTYYVVTPSSDNDRGRDLKPMIENKKIVEKRWSEGSKTVGGMVMDVNPERIVMTLYDRNGKVQDTYTAPSRR